MVRIFPRQGLLQQSVARPLGTAAVTKEEKDRDVSPIYPLLDTRFNQYRIAYRYRRSLELLRGYLVYRIFSINFLVNNQVKVEWTRAVPLSSHRAEINLDCRLGSTPSRRSLVQSCSETDGLWAFCRRGNCPGDNTSDQTLTEVRCTTHPRLQRGEWWCWLDIR